METSSLRTLLVRAARATKTVLACSLLLGVYMFVRMTGCTATQQQKIKDVVKVVEQCVAPSAADAAAAYADCMAQPGATPRWCAAHASLAGIAFVECLWKHHLEGKCESSCPFHESADGGTVAP